MKIRCSYTEKGDGIENEDAVGYSDNAFWIIDGATDLFKKNILGTDDDVAVYVKVLNSYLKENMNNKDFLKEILRKSIEMTNDTLGLMINEHNSYELPSFAIIIIRCCNDRCEYYVLGDCSLLVLEKGNISKISDKRLKFFSERNRAGLKTLLKERNYSKEQEEAIYGNTRKLMNKVEGYWIGSVDCRGLENAICGSIPITEGAQLLAYSDGLLEAFELFEIAKEDETIFGKAKLEQIVLELRKCQIGDKERKVARVRKKDDLSYILVRY